jgi:methionyl-tRNA formyltransferase
MDLNIVFMGSPEFAIPSLEILAREFHVVGVVTQPDRPSGRGRVLTSPPVKKLAAQLNIPVIQPLKVNSDAVLERLIEWKAELIVVAAYGQLLRSNVLNFPRYGCLNVHASLLPRWRGASPIQAAIFHGDKLTGTTIMKMDAGLDTGPIIAQKPLEISDDDTADSLEKRLAILGAELLSSVLPDHVMGRLTPKPQGDTGVTYAHLLKKEDGELDLTRSVFQLVLQVRAYSGWPGAYINVLEEKIKIIKAHAIEDTSTISSSLEIINKYPAIKALDGWLVLDEVQPAGKRIMSGKDFLSGAKAWKQ